MQELEEENDTILYNPREDDNLTTMVCFHNRYILGDKQTKYKQQDYDSWSALKNDIVAKEHPILIKPIYMYDHSGITIATTPFSCSWDSGQIGWVYITKHTVSNLGVVLENKEDWKHYINRLDAYLESEIKEYDKYLVG